MMKKIEFAVLTAVDVKSTVLWCVTPCRLADNLQYFVDTWLPPSS